MRIALSSILFFGVLAGAAQAGDGLEACLLPLVKNLRGKVALAVRHLQTGEGYSLDADEPMPTASLIKLAVMIELYQQAAEGKLKLSDPVTLQKEDKVPGSGVLTDHFTPGLTFPLRDAAHLMIAYSDNTATNLILDRIGVAATGKRMEAWGFPHTRIYAKVFKGKTTSIDPEGSKRFGLGSTTAREMVGLLEKLHTGRLVNPEACKEMLDLLARCEDHEKFTRLLPENVKVAHKTGSLDEIRTDAGILTFPGGPVAVCVLTKENQDHRWVVDNEGNLFCARVAKEVYDYFTAKVKAKTVGALR
jgi:beta-lactamase class A